MYTYHYNYFINLDFNTKFSLGSPIVELYSVINLHFIYLYFIKITGCSLNTERTTAGIFRLAGTPNLKTPLNLENLDMLEYPFLTLCKYPIGFILQLGSTVCARSVKLLERVPNPDEPETRDFWWTELRMEIRSHARALGCNVILGYTEITSIS